MKFGIVLSCYDRVDDLMAHLDILKFNQFAPRIAVVYMHPDAPPRMPHGVELIRLPSPGFTSGPLVSATRGIKWASAAGMDYMVFRNADDWLFRHDLARGWIDQMEAGGQIAAGYSWFSVGTMRDVTLNENIFRVDRFIDSADDAERYFLSSDQSYNCEYKMAWWVNRVTKENADLFFRLPDREQEPGIGWEIKDLPGVYHKDGKTVPPDVWMKLEHNSRFFNRKWQMIGSHDNTSRMFYWRQIRNSVPYAAQLEECHHFARWMAAAATGSPWNKEDVNLSRATRQLRPRPVRTKKELPRILVPSKVCVPSKRLLKYSEGVPPNEPRNRIHDPLR